MIWMRPSYKVTIRIQYMRCKKHGVITADSSQLHQPSVQYGGIILPRQIFPTDDQAAFSRNIFLRKESLLPQVFDKFLFLQ